MSANSAIQHVSAGLGAYIGGQILVRSQDGDLHKFNMVGIVSVAATLFSLWLAGQVKAAVHTRPETVNSESGEVMAGGGGASGGLAAGSLPLTDANSHTVSVAYDSAGRVGTITRPDSTTEKFTNDQESGWTNSGTSVSPAPATLLAQAGSTLHQPEQQHDDDPARLDGPGPARQRHRPAGQRPALRPELQRPGHGGRRPGQPEHAVFSYDSKGNVTSILYEDGNYRVTTPTTAIPSR